MVGTYEIVQGSVSVGSVTVKQQGLYYEFSCRCRLSGAVVHRLWVACGGKEENLGVLIPMDGAFGLEKKLPTKYLGEGKPDFELRTVRGESDGRFVPIYPDEPFSYMTRLKDAFLVRRSGCVGIVISE